ncbi:hypothetical protein FNF29_04422 [Cafeteria roenbergensis]|uniref:JmjC domain-containing protein n=1 Tax=Cafeteria roenbergensis TaxID=33653 RepID=A0A5A8CG47_CAFRO|nr:hypothetical protein FNF29_04422 [Cafeteria roenbergensis]|eukprot:KAA0151738.1 hypothetical protein FNF29_04422 [Cafeteria roenbergensis]
MPEPCSAEEERLLRIAVEVSRRDQGMEAVRAPECPVFTPTVEEFRDPMAYMRKIAPVGWKHGIVKIVPPVGWRPACGVTKRMASRPLATRKQLVHELQEGREFDDGKDYTLPEYKAMADRFAATRFPELSATTASAPAKPEPAYWARPHATRDLGPPSSCMQLAPRVEDAYWRIVEARELEVVVEYGNDQDVRVNGSGFSFPDPGDACAGDPDRVPVDFRDPQFYKRSGWNLNVMPFAKGSLLAYMKEKVAGINVPWLYVGMLFASFAWHTEDNYLYSVNYMHYGTAKTWYGIPASGASAFDATVREHLFEQFKQEPDHIHKLTTVFSPAKVQAAGIPVVHTVQEPGEFVITFPRSYHSGFSHGFNIAEACNFALADWVPMGRLAIRHYETVARDNCFSQEEILLRAAAAPDKLDAQACSLLAADLRIIAEQARLDLESFLALPGVSKAQVVLLSEDHQRYNCAVSRRLCHVSAVVCESEACRLEAEKARIEARRVFAKERAALIAVGVDPTGIVESDPQHQVVLPRFADELCDCKLSNLRMVVWFTEEMILGLCAKLEARRDELLRDVARVKTEPVGASQGPCASSAAVGVRRSPLLAAVPGPSVPSSSSSSACVQAELRHSARDRSSAAMVSAARSASTSPMGGDAVQERGAKHDATRGAATARFSTPPRGNTMSASDSPMTAVSSAPAAADCDALGDAA